MRTARLTAQIAACIAIAAGMTGCSSEGPTMPVQHGHHVRVSSRRGTFTGAVIAQKGTWDGHTAWLVKTTCGNRWALMAQCDGID